MCRDDLLPMSAEAAVSCFCLLLRDLLGAAQAALQVFDQDHDYLRICGETGQAISAVLQPQRYMLGCREHAVPGQRQPAAAEVRLQAPRRSRSVLGSMRLKAKAAA